MPETLHVYLIGTGHQLVSSGDHLLRRGHVIAGVVSADATVSDWCASRDIRHTADAAVALTWMQDGGCDYLFSIVNHALLTPAMLAVPSRGAINYHDSLLPAYGGFNATSWAILEGQHRHGVTWHLMTEQADGGPVLLQQSFDITDDDTAFTVGVKCSEAGIATFAVLLKQLEEGRLQPRAQVGARSFHRRAERPGVGILDFSKSAAELSAVVRALDFGPEDSWMVRPKVLLPTGFLTVSEARTSPGRSASGTLVGISARGLEVGTSDGVLLIGGFTDLDGRTLDPVSVATSAGLLVGQRLPSMSPEQVARFDAFDASITRDERFWVDRLATLHPATLPGLAPTPSTSRTPRRVLSRAAPSSLACLPPADREQVLLGALAVFAHRLGGGDPLDLAVAAEVPPGAESLFETVVPFRARLAAEVTFADVRRETAEELAVTRSRGTFARDARLRYRAERGRAADALRLPIGFLSHRASGITSPAARTIPGDALTLVADGDGGYGWSYDERALTYTAMSALAERYDVLLSAALASPDTVVARLPLLPSAEREQLLGGWQGESCAYEPDCCMHQHVERQVARTPDATALVFGDEHVTYRELNARANGVANRLRAAGVGPEVLVGICVERSIDMMVGLLGILKAGGAYVPMDPAYPAERLAIMLEDSRAPVVLTQRPLQSLIPVGQTQVMFVDEPTAPLEANPTVDVRADHLAYVIFTSGSTGRPKGTMLEHRNVSNFFTGMDAALAPVSTGGVWLAVTSISFDISVLELFWALSRGFQVVIAPENSRAALEVRQRLTASATPAMGFGLFYFAADSAEAGGDAYRLMLEGAKFADAHGFTAVWTPERHFHAFGGLYPNPAVTSAAIAAITHRVQIRAGSIVLPLHNPLRVAEDWAVIDQLSHGRVGLSFASGWHVNDFAFMPDAYESRREVMLEHIDTVRALWRGEKVSVRNGAGRMIDVAVLPHPVQANPPIWIASAGSVETFVLAGRLGYNVLTNMLGQDLDDLRVKFAAYHAARREHGHEGTGTISVMLHTFVCGSTDEARALARKPFADYLASSYDLVKVAPKMFPAFRQPSREDATDGDGASDYTVEDMTALLEHAFDRYFETAGLFGTPERALEMVDRLASIGATEVACLIDFGIAADTVLESLPHLHRLQELCRSRAAQTARAAAQNDTIVELIRRHGVTHLQCTPSMARALAADAASLQSLGALDALLLGGEALPADLARQLSGVVRGRLYNMYGPTETTVWSTTAEVSADDAPTIGKPIANTTIRVLDAHGELVPIGADGELYIGGAGVARGYLNRPELTAERFVPDPFVPGARLYRTGDLVRHRDDGDLEFLGRLDHQVKISGHRIELAEIEQVLMTHPAVREAVVVARPGRRPDAPQTLVAYVVPSTAATSVTTLDGTVAGWQQVWDETYRESIDRSQWDDPRFRIAGWTDSHTGRLLSIEQMREWRDTTVAQIRALHPTRVLEIGCGTGLMLFPLLPHVEHYTALDISAAALDTIRAELTAEEARKVELRQARADEIDQLSGRHFDLVIINSVAQYFPGADYLVRVLQNAVALVADGGHVFVGDLRSLDHLRAFSTSVELQQAPDHAGAGALRERIERRMAQESELLVSESFFHAVARETPRIAAVDVALKRGRARNEMTNFRFDAILRVGAVTGSQAGSAPAGSAPAGSAPAAPTQPVTRLDEVRALLARQPEVVHLVDMPNARLAHVAAVEQALLPDASPIDVLALRARAEGAHQGIDPADLATVDEAYHVTIRWARSGDPLRFDALLWRRAATPATGANGTGESARLHVTWPGDVTAASEPPSAYANTPVGRVRASAVAQWREHLGARLPEYMVPSQFVTLTALPLTPNGKIDRKALPEPEGAHEKPAVSYAPPGTALEQQIAEVWRTLLAVDRVGRQDNLFDLGANSLLTMQASNRLSARLGRKVPLVSMFRFPTVASLAEHLADSADRGATPANTQRVEERVSRAEQAAMRRRALRAGRGDG